MTRANIRMKFSDVYSFGNLVQLEGKMNEGGVYIWGLVFLRQNNKLIGYPVDNTESFDKAKHIFIPYYVGQSGKNLWDCFSQRHNNSLRNNLYLILSYDYIKYFYNDSHFPEMLGSGCNRKRGWFEKDKQYFKGKIVYYNNYPILQDLYQFNNGELALQETYSTQYLRDALVKAKKIPDARNLEKYRNAFFRKMFFCYAKGFRTNELNYEDFETYIFYRLKGKTISKHLTLEYAIQKFASTSVNIKSSLNLFKPTISRIFNGY
jgi:hypothetical protein